MTPHERQLIDELFDRLSRLEDQPRDPEAERAITEGLALAPHALYPLVQTVLVQDEALRVAEDRIRELSGDVETPQQDRSFLDNARETLLGPDPNRRGSVPSVGGSSVPSAGSGRGSVWNIPRQQPGYQQPPGYQQQPGYQPQYQQPVPQGGGSFLGTAAAAATGVIGGSLLFNSLGSMFGGDKAHAGAQKFGETGGDSPWGSGGAGNSDLARDAGLNDVGGGHGDRQGAFDTAQNISDDPGGDGGFDVGGDGGDGGDGSSEA